MDRKLPLSEILKRRRAKRAAAVPLINAALEAGTEGLDPSKLEIPNLIYTPVEPTDLGVMGAMGVGGPWAFSRLMGSPISLARSAALGFGPVALPLGAVGDLANTFIGPVADPYYQLGLRGYFDSLGKGVSRNIEQMGEAADEAQERYGMLGVPVQMTHGLMNPITSAMYLGKSLKEYLMGPPGEDAALEAHGAVNRALERM